MFDYIFITHLPAFYKINLYNALSKKLKICVIFIGKQSKIRTSDFISNKMDFEYYFLSDKNFENRNIILTGIKLFSILKKLRFKKVVVGGWDLIEFWLAILINNKNKNSLALESSLNDSSYHGIKKMLKKFFLSKITTVFASGSNHKKLLDKLDYEENIFITKGVGLIDKTSFEKKNDSFQNNFLYVGRLSKEKNLPRLIEVFNELPQFNLNIVGSGNLENELKKIANKNIHFINHVDNKKINEIFLKNDVFILPSLSETWGLVIEEALYYGLPVIISNRVGCGPELIKDRENGIIFTSSSIDELKKSIMEMAQNYMKYHTEVKDFNLEEKDRNQINCYNEALN
jgi:glycosyltransferase involved in cell wall biosynthesis